MRTTLKRATVYVDPEIHRAVRIKAAQSDRTISDVINEALRLSLSEDAEDLAAFEERAEERNVPLETVLARLKARGKL